MDGFWVTFYRPQQSWGKVMFLQLSMSIILFTGGGLPHIHPGKVPNGQTPPSPGQALPLGRPPRKTPSVQCMLGYGQPAGGTHPSGMQSCLESTRENCA